MQTYNIQQNLIADLTTNQYCQAVTYSTEGLE